MRFTGNRRRAAGRGHARIGRPSGLAAGVFTGPSAGAPGSAEQHPGLLASLLVFGAGVVGGTASGVLAAATSCDTLSLFGAALGLVVLVALRSARQG